MKMLTRAMINDMVGGESRPQRTQTVAGSAIRQRSRDLPTHRATIAVAISSHKRIAKLRGTSPISGGHHPQAKADKVRAAVEMMFHRNNKGRAAPPSQIKVGPHHQTSISNPLGLR